MLSLVSRAVLFCLLFASVPAYTCRAVAFASGTLTVGNIGIVPTSGSISFLSPWTAEAIVDADGTGEFDVTFDGVTPVIKFVASTHGFALAATSPLPLSSLVSSTVSIPDATVASSFATARGSLYTSFMVTGGTGAVDVTFSADLAATLSVMTSGIGTSASAETIFSLELDGSSILFRRDPISIGPSDNQDLIFSASLSASRSLEFGVPYFIFIQPDAEARAVSGVPESWTLLHAGVTLASVVFVFALLGKSSLARRTPSA